MTSWHKDEEEASRKRAIERDNKATEKVGTAKTSGTVAGKQGGETAREESKREEADRVARHVRSRLMLP